MGSEKVRVRENGTNIVQHHGENGEIVHHTAHVRSAGEDMLQKYFNATRERETLRSYVELNISVSCPVQGSVRVPCGARSHHSRRESVIYSLC